MDLTTASANVAASPALLPARASRARRRLPCNARTAGRSQPLPRNRPALVGGLSTSGDRDLPLPSPPLTSPTVDHSTSQARHR